MSVLEVDQLGHYLRLHLMGSAGGVELFGRGGSMPDPTMRDAVLRLRDEVAAERRWLVALTERLGHRRAVVGETAAKIGERLGRLKPNGHPIRRTPLTDVVDLEGMLAAVHVKRAGWDSLLACESELDATTVDELRDLRARATTQLQTLEALHATAARHAFADALHDH